MARIPVYNNTQRIDPGPFAQAAYRIGRSASATGSAIKGAFDAAGNAVNNYEDHQAQQEQSDLSAKFSDLDMKLTEKYEKAKQSGDVSKPTFAEDFVSNNIEPELDALGADLSTEKGQQMYQQASQKMRAEYFKRGVADQVTASGVDAVSNFKGMVKSYANIVTTDPTLTEHAASMIDTLAPNLPQEHRGALTQAAKASVYAASADAWVSALAKNPNATPEMVDHVRKYLDDPKNGYVDNTDPESFEAAHKRLDTIQDTLGAVQSHIAEQAWPDLMARVKSIGVDVDHSAQALIDNYQGTNAKETAVWKAAHQRDLDATLEYGKTTSYVTSAPRQDVLSQIGDNSAAISAAKPDDLRPLQAKQAALVAALKQRDQAFSNDPTGYVISTSAAVSARYQAFAQKPSAATFDQFVTASVAEQKRLYPDVVPRIVTNDMEQHIGQELAGIANDKEGATQVGASLASYQQVMGPHWDQAVGELYHDKVLNKAQYVAASMFAKPQATGLAQDLLRASVLTPEELTRTGDVTSDKANKAAHDALAPLAATLVDAANGRQLLDAYQSSLAKLIQYKGDANAAPQIAAKMILGEYQFKGTMRMPTNVDAGKVVAGAKSVLGDIGNHKLVVPPSFSGTGPVDQRAEYIQNVQDYGHWSTSQSGDTAVLYDQQGTPVYETVNNQRRQVALKWSDLEKLGDGKTGFLSSMFGG